MFLDTTVIFPWLLVHLLSANVHTAQVCVSGWLHEYWDPAWELHWSSLNVPSLSTILFICLYLDKHTHPCTCIHTHVDTEACLVVIALLGYWTPNHEVTTVSSRAPFALASKHLPLSTSLSKQTISLGSFRPWWSLIPPKIPTILLFLRDSLTVSLFFRVPPLLLSRLPVSLIFLRSSSPTFLVLFLVPAPIFNKTRWNWKNTRFFASIWGTSRLLYSSASFISLCLQSLILSSFDFYHSCPWRYRKLRLILITFSHFRSVTETLRSPPCVIATIRSMHYP